MRDFDKKVLENPIKSREDAEDIRARCFEICEMPLTMLTLLDERVELSYNLCRLYMYDKSADSYVWEVLDAIANMHETNLENMGLASALRAYECFLDRNDKPLEKQLSYCEREIFSSYYEDVYPFRLRANILRGENELSGNLIEISWGFYKILVECGLSLKDDDNNNEIIEKLKSGCYEAVVISHPHLDHNGLISKVPKNIPVYMGEKSVLLYKLKNPNEDISNFVPYSDGVKFNRYPKITPFLCDHSTFDSYMLLFETDKEKILYTGDFRSTGNKSFEKLLSLLPKEVDLLITEGTNLHDNKLQMTEKEMEEKMENIMSGDGPVFVLTSSHNIDRIVNVYKASVRNNRDMYVNLYQAKVLSIAGDSVPNPKFYDRVKIVYPHGISEKEMENYVYYKNKSVSVTKLAENSRFTMLITTNDIHYLTKMKEINNDVFKNATFVYSLWTGYKVRDDMQEFLEKIKEFGMKEENIHTSGHANKRDIIRLKLATHPKEIRYVHVR